MDKIETYYIWVISVEKGRPDVFQVLWQITWIKVIFAQTHLVFDVKERQFIFKVSNLLALEH